MRSLPLVLLIAALVGCSGGGKGASLDAHSDSEGVLYVNGTGWEGCSRIRVTSRNWASSESPVSRNGQFALVYAHPEVMPYSGVVKVTCSASANQSTATKIRVGDARSRK